MDEINIERRTWVCRIEVGNRVMCIFSFFLIVARYHWFAIQYRAPEMVDLYSNRVINTKADIWALGCLLYKLCFFEDAFGDSALSIMSGKYRVPDEHPFSPALMDLLRAYVGFGAACIETISLLCCILLKCPSNGILCPYLVSIFLSFLCSLSLSHLGYLLSLSLSLSLFLLFSFFPVLFSLLHLGSLLQVNPDARPDIIMITRVSTSSMSLLVPCVYIIPLFCVNPDLMVATLLPP